MQPASHLRRCAKAVCAPSQTHPMNPVFPMKNTRLLLTGILTAGLCITGTGMAQIRSARVTVLADKPGIKVSPSLWGIFYEEINHAGDGGIYAELVQNRAFEEIQPAAGAKMEGDQMVTPQGFKHDKWYQNTLHAWSLIAEADTKATITLDTAKPLNEKTPHSLRLDVLQTGTRAGFANEGYWGMSVKQAEVYDLSFYARTEGNLTVTAQLESADGKKTYAKATVAGVTGNWQRYACKLTATGTDPKARLSLCISKPGTVWFDVVSLFPKTYKNRPNGLRSDLVKQLEDLRPGFVRFPGGCVVEGVTLENRIQWKNTIGDIARRPGRWDLWGYHNTEGLGFHEYLQLCEDLNSEPMYVVSAGLSCAWRNPEAITTPEALQPYIQDTLDALEYANGPATSKWGAERAKNGHPEPFNIRYVEIGNENSGDPYFKNYRPFYDAIKAKYPDIITIADCPIPNAPVEIVDEHYYVAPEWFFANAKKYDTYDRKGPKIYVGEYAVNSNVGSGNLLGALSEAAFMIGMERNSDIVTMASYAPLFENVHNRAWAVNLIRFDSARSTGRSSYHVQTMFSKHRPDVTLATQVEEIGTPAPTLRGGIGVGTWNTQAEYKDIHVEHDGKTLFRSDFTQGTNGWKLIGGTWKTENAALSQTASGDNRLALAGDASWTDYTLTLKARKLGGAEGFLILFHVKDEQNMAQWNIGGWRNARSSVEQKESGTNRELDKGPDGGIESQRWYDIKIEVQGSKVVCSLDGKIIQTITLQPPQAPAALYALGGKDEKTGQIIIKAVNPGPHALDTTFRIESSATLTPTARVTTLSSANLTDENTLEEPDKVVPVASTFDGIGPEFHYSLKPHSLTILQIDTAAPATGALTPWPNEAPANGPFPQSESLTGVVFTGRHAEYTGADTWYPSWAADGNLYSPWTDGNVNGLTSFSGGENASTGHATILGDDPLKLTVIHQGVFKSNPRPYDGRYPCGSLVHDGIWYYGTYCLNPSGSIAHEGKTFNWPWLGPFVGFRTSRDYGKTWTETPCSPAKPLFGEHALNGEPLKIGAPHFVDFGKGMQHSPDGMAYLVAQGASDGHNRRFAYNSWITADQAYLIRVKPGIDQMNDASKYEFFAGNAADGTARWTHDFTQIKPIAEWRDHMGCVTMTYNAPLKKFLMCVTDGTTTVARFNTYILESDRITGPWKRVSYFKHFGEQAYFVNFPSKFISEDGRSLWLCYSGNFSDGWDGIRFKSIPTGSRYAMCLQEVRLVSPNNPITLPTK